MMRTSKMKELFKLKLYIGFYIMSFFMMMTLSWMSKHKMILRG